MTKLTTFRFTILSAALAAALSPVRAAETAGSLPTVTATAPVSSLAEEANLGAYKQPEWTSARRFSTTRVYIQKDPWEVGFEQWWRVRHYRDGTTKHLFTEEIEIGLPNRMQLDIYWDWAHEKGETSHKDVAFELRWALADWGVIPLNPTLYGEYKITDPKFGGDVFEVKLLLGDEIAKGLHWGLNLAYEREIGGELANEFAVAQGLSYTIIDQVLSAGLEMQFKYENVAGERNNGEHKFQIGPSVQWRPTKNTHIDIVGLFGCTNDSPRFEGFLIFGFDFGGGEHAGGGKNVLAPSPGDSRYRPVSGQRN